MDHGAYKYDALDDYPDFIFPAAKAVANDAHSRGIIFGGSGQGEAIAANRIRGVRAAVYYNGCLLYTSPSPRDLSTSRMPSSA